MKNTIRKALRYFGYDIIRVAPCTTQQKDYKVNVGRFQLLMPAYSPLIKTYNDQTDFGSEIERIVDSVVAKYPQLFFVDIGANVGDTVARVKSIKDIRVLSIEGDEIAYSYLEQNIGQFNNVTVIKSYLGDVDKTISAELQKRGWNTTIVPTSTGTTQIPIRAFDSLLSDEFLDPAINAMKLLKIDTEGFDTIIIRGCKKYIAQTKPIIYFEYNRDNMRAINEDGLNTLFELEKSGYQKIHFYDDRGRFILATDLQNKVIIESLHNYADGKRGLIYYYNICLFHEEDSDLASTIFQGENRD